MYQILKFKSGVVKDLTAYAAGKAGPFWIDSNLVRFRNGFPAKIGGWQKNTIFALDPSSGFTSTEQQIIGSARSIVLWRSFSDEEDRIAIGTHNHLFMLENDHLYDITPLRKETSNLSNPLAVTDGSTTITVTDASHGATAGDFVKIKSGAATGGISADTINAYYGYQIQTVINNNSYTITSPTAATSDATGGGTTIDIEYLIGNAEGLGNQTASPALGWGTGAWNGGTWNTPRATSESDVNLENSQWSLNLWGEDLIATVRNGAIYYFDVSDSATRAALVSAEAGASDVPAINRVTTISFPDRHAIAAGCTSLAGVFDPMLVRFSTQEDFTKWTPTSENTAGDQRLEIGTKIVGMVASKEETLISTDEAMYGMSFIGPPFTFSFRLLGTNCGAGGKNTMISVDGNVYWMGQDTFFIYDGTVREIPCPVKFFVFDRMQQIYIDKCFAGHNKEFNEVTWWYPSTANSDDENPEPDSYVTYNYFEDTWSVGSMTRTCWSDAFGAVKNPVAIDEGGYLYNQETGTSDNGSNMAASIESSYIELDPAGDRNFLIDKVVPDATMETNTNLFLTVNAKKYPSADAVAKGPFTITPTTQKTSLRAKGRQVNFKIESTGTQDSWVLGDFRINAREDSLR